MAPIEDHVQPATASRADPRDEKIQRLETMLQHYKFAATTWEKLANQYQSDKNKLATANEKLTAENMRLTEANKKLSDKDEKLARDKMEVIEIMKDIEKVTAENMAVVTENEKVNAENKKVVAEIENIAAEISKVAAENKELREARQQHKKEIESSDQILSKLQQEIQWLTEEHQYLTVEKGELEERNQHLGERCLALEDEVARLKVSGNEQSRAQSVQDSGNSDDSSFSDAEDEVKGETDGVTYWDGHIKEDDMEESEFELVEDVSKLELVDLVEAARAWAEHGKEIKGEEVESKEAESESDVDSLADADYTETPKKKPAKVVKLPIPTMYRPAVQKKKQPRGD
jgi:chromosome segregation ATPase